MQEDKRRQETEVLDGGSVSAEGARARLKAREFSDSMKSIPL